MRFRLQSLVGEALSVVLIEKVCLVLRALHEMPPHMLSLCFLQHGEVPPHCFERRVLSLFFAEDNINKVGSVHCQKCLNAGRPSVHRVLDIVSPEVGLIMSCLLSEFIYHLSISCWTLFLLR